MTTNSDGAWELPHEFRQMQETARRFMRERVVPAEKPLPHDAIALPDEVLKPLQEEAKKLGFWHVESPVRMGRRGAEPARAGDRRGGVLAVQDGPLYPGLSCLRLRPAEFDLPRPQGSDREIRGAGDCERRQDLRRNLGAERRRRSWPRDPDARREDAATAISSTAPSCGSPASANRTGASCLRAPAGRAATVSPRSSSRRSSRAFPTSRSRSSARTSRTRSAFRIAKCRRKTASATRAKASSSPRPGWSTRAFPTRRP